LTNPGISRALLACGRLAALAAAMMVLVFVTVYGYELLRYAFSSRGPGQGDVGILPVFYALRVAVVGWVVWAVAKLDGRDLMRALLAAFGISFLLLYGWYFAILVIDDAFLYVVVAGDSLYLAGGLLVGCALLLADRGRVGDGRA
jgi:hypothetical protein